jgi:hypothetical protein
VFYNTEFLLSNHQAWQLCCVCNLASSVIFDEGCCGEGDDKRVPLGIVQEDDFLSLNTLHGSFDKECDEDLLLYIVSD